MRRQILGEAEIRRFRFVGNPEVIHFIRCATRRRRFFRCTLAVSNFRSRSA